MSKKNIRNLIWAFVCTLAFPIYISDTTINFSNSIFSILMCFSIYAILKTSSSFKKDRRLLLYSHILGFLFSFMLAAGRSLDTYNTIYFRKLFICIILYTHVIATCISLFWNFLINWERILQNGSMKKARKASLDKIITYLVLRPYLIMFLLLVCWLPCFIADFPGGFRYDATRELNQLINGYNGNFPILHSAIITWLLPFLYNLTGSYNTGVAIYVSLQMCLIAGIYSHIIYIFGKKGVNKILLFCIFVYCGLFPVIQILVVQEVRDILFGALLMYMIFLFYYMSSDRRSFFQTPIYPCLTSIVFVLTLLARSNGIGILILLIVLGVNIVILAFNAKEHLKGAVLFSVTGVGACIVMGIWLTNLCQPMTPANSNESLSIMSQSISRAYIYENEKWSEEEVKELKKYMDLDGLKYYDENADPTKQRLHYQDDFWGFFKFWCRIGRKHLGCYIDSFLANSQNMWYPDSVIDGYKQIYTEEGQPYYNFDKCYYYITPSLESPVEHMNLWPTVLKYYTQIGLYISFEKIPVVSMLFSIGFQFWIILNCLFYILYRRIKKLILPVLILVSYMLISSFVPLVLLRYFVAAFFSVPMIIVFTFQPSHVNDSSPICY